MGSEKGSQKGSEKQLRFGVFREGGFPENACVGGQFLKEILRETQQKITSEHRKHTKQSSAQRFLNDPFPKTPFFSC